MIKATDINVTITRRMTETTGAYNGAILGAISGLVEGTKVVTAKGFQRVEEIKAGDRVVTHDNGLQVVRAVRRTPVWTAAVCPRSMQPLFVPAGAIGNAADMILLPHQAVMVDSAAAREELGDASVLMLAKDLEGVRGITRITPEAPAYVVSLEFDNDEVIFAASGAMCICRAAVDVDAVAPTRAYTTLKSRSDAGLVAAVRAELSDDLARAA
ncbi:Hint domain-containing protein [Pseudooceanicola nitratireducens]|uniref:Hint domain-containing protein n=1 Tax=Pseudooceanicola nitratireducens TaxID=517719 RepID=UPI001C96D22E|nr:Hint domain-containing protein [Pseudooceanicola nitratireducens]MBY6158499.1 Hint domain-containing protein [Pseudooceanicola nitratireducens]